MTDTPSDYGKGWFQHSTVHVLIDKHRETGRLLVTLRGGTSGVHVSGETGDNPLLVMFTILRLWLLGAKRVAATVDDRSTKGHECRETVRHE